MMPDEQIAPDLIAEAGYLRSTDDVGEQRRRQHAILLQRLVLAGPELLHGRQDAVCVALVSVARHDRAAHCGCRVRYQPRWRRAPDQGHMMKRTPWAGTDAPGDRVAHPWE
jgi:hypothetical protein